MNEPQPNRVVRVERKAVIGDCRLKQALRGWEDSVKLNTSFVERLNLTIGQGSSYLGRRTHAKPEGSNIDDDLELLRLILREIFSSRELFVALKHVILVFFDSARPVDPSAGGMALAVNNS
jgi:hypothetical protein